MKIEKKAAVLAVLAALVLSLVVAWFRFESAELSDRAGTGQ